MNRLQFSKNLAFSAGGLLLVIPVVQFLLPLVLFRVIYLCYFPGIFISMFFGLLAVKAGTGVTKQPIFYGPMLVVLGVIISAYGLLSNAPAHLIPGILAGSAGILALIYEGYATTQAVSVPSNITASYTSGYPSYRTPIEQAIALARYGQTVEAHRHFKAMLFDYPSDVNLLLWAAYTAPDMTEAQRLVIRAGQIEPANPGVEQAKEWLLRQTMVEAARR